MQTTLTLPQWIEFLSVLAIVAYGTWWVITHDDRVMRRAGAAWNDAERHWMPMGPRRFIDVDDGDDD